MHSQSIKEAVRKLRMKGMSYNEIQTKTGISKSTLHSWLSGMQIPQSSASRIRKRVRDGSLRGLLKRNKLQTHLARQRASMGRKEGEALIKALSQRDLLILGTALYWGEGYKRTIIRKGKRKTDHPVSLSNSDPRLVSAFVAFLTKCLDVQIENIEISLHLYEHINEEEAINYWQKATNLPISSFKKTYYGISIASTRKRAYQRLPFGTAQVRVNSTPLFHKIMGLIEGLARESQN